MNLKKIRLAIIGLGYVGLPLAVEFSKKRKVVGFDAKKSRIDELNSGLDKTLEDTIRCIEHIQSFGFSKIYEKSKYQKLAEVTLIR